MRSHAHILPEAGYRWNDFFFYAFILLILANRLALFFCLTLDHIDSDQPVMWLGARHFSEGLFYEPRYYGQDYNTFLEALLAVPFIKLGMPVYYAVPLITHLLFLTPFLFTAIYLFRINYKAQALLVLIILLCMPTGYDMMNAIPRGFVTGIFFTAPFILSILHPGNLKYLLLNTFFACVAYLVNQNSLLVSIPFLFYVFLQNHSYRKYYLFSLAALCLALPIAFLLDYFYIANPEYVLHDFKSHFSLDLFINAIRKLDDRFAHINFFADEKCVYLLIVLFFSGILFFKRNKKAFYAYLLFLGILLTSLFSSKIADGAVWPYYSYSRMYLGIPVVLYLFFSVAVSPPRSIIICLTIVALVFSIFKGLSLQKNIAQNTQDKKWVFIHLTSMNTMLELVDHFKEVCEKQGVNDLVVVNDFWVRSELCYGGPALYPDFPNTLMSEGERRTWRIREEKAKITEKFVMLIPDYDFDKKGLDTLYHFKIRRLDDYGCFLIENSSRTIPAFLETIGSPVNGPRSN